MEQQSFIAAFLSEIRLTVSPLPEKIEMMAQFPDLGLRELLFGQNAPFCEVLPPRRWDEKKAMVWLMQDSFHCRYVLADSPHQTQQILLGPYCTEEISLKDILCLYQKLQIPVIDTNMLRQYYLSLPQLRDESFMDALIHAHCMTTYGPQGYEIGYWKLEAAALPAPAQSRSVQMEHVRRSMEQHYAAEQEMMDFVTQGNYYGAASVKSKLGLRNQYVRTGSTLRDHKNNTIIFNTLCRVAAAQGGVPPFRIDECSNRFALEIETSGSTAELRAIRERMLKEYCDLVRSSTPESFTPLVRQAVDILSADYSEAILLASVAGKLNISPNYLSTLFKKETGHTFTEYLTGIRIEHAKKMLTKTRQPIGEIALACGISDLNYFSRLFKANENVTPTQFRESTKAARKIPRGRL